jgi:UDPglucose 6-dehydrogenase
VLIDHLLKFGAKLRSTTPEAMTNVRATNGGNLAYCDLPLEALNGADALAIVTEWAEFRVADFDEMKARMRQPTIFDGRNLYKPRQMASLGFTYRCIGTISVAPP